MNLENINILELNKVDSCTNCQSITVCKPEKYKPKMKSIVIFMIGMSLIEFAQKDLTGS